MDGLAEDADVLFLLTTNRPEILEPALASRPGRIDQADRGPAARRGVPPAAVRALRRGLRLEAADLEPRSSSGRGA